MHTAPGVRRRSSVALLFLAACLPGCSSNYFKDGADWEALHARGSTSAALPSIRSAGFESCANLLEDGILHATEGHDGYSVVGWSPTETDDRSSTVIIFFIQDGDHVQAEVTAGLDGSGKCFARWTSTRTWRETCDRLLRKSEWLSDYKLFAQATSDSAIYKRDGGNINVSLTRIGHRRCLMIAGETVYWLGPSRDAPQVQHFPYKQEQESPP